MIFLLAAGSTLLAQQPLYPIGNGGARVESSPYQEDRPAFVAEKGIEYKLTLGYPRDDQAGFLRETDAKVIVLWLKVENVSRHSITVDTRKFAVTDKSGRPYPRLASNDAFNRIIAGRGLGKKAVSKGLSSITLGKLSGKSSEDEARDEATRFVFPDGEIAAQGLKQGLLYFEAPYADSFTVSVSLGDLWPAPFTFTNIKAKK